LREIIAYQLEQESDAVFSGALGRTLVADEKANVVVGQPVKSPYLAC